MSLSPLPLSIGPIPDDREPARTVLNFEGIDQFQKKIGVDDRIYLKVQISVPGAGSSEGSIEVVQKNWSARKVEVITHPDATLKTAVFDWVTKPENQSFKVIEKPLNLPALSPGKERNVTLTFVSSPAYIEISKIEIEV